MRSANVFSIVADSVAAMANKAAMRLKSAAAIGGRYALKLPGGSRKKRAVLEEELVRLSREQAMAHFENRLLNDLASKTDVTSACKLLLRRIISVSTPGLAAIFDVSHSSPKLIASRGAAASSRLTIPQEILSQLQTSSFVECDDPIDNDAQLHMESTRDSSIEEAGFIGVANELTERPPLSIGIMSFFEAMSLADRRLATKVWFFGIYIEEELIAVLVTSRLLPIDGSVYDQQQTLSRVAQTVARQMKVDRELKRQSDELRSTREMLDLRTIADHAHDRPLEALGLYVSRLREALIADRVSLYLRSRRTDDSLEPVVSSEDHLMPTNHLAWKTLESELVRSTMNTALPADYDAEALLERDAQSPFRSAVVRPLVKDGQLLGTLVLSHQHGQNMTTPQQRMLDWSSDLMTSTLRRIFDDAAIRRQARRDGLTDLTNRRTFDTLLAGEVDRVRLGLSGECSLLLADIDRFKSVNDTHGHPAGDAVLRAVARLLQEQLARMRIGERCVLARYGGEEMVVLLPGVGLAGAARLAEEMRRAVESHVISFQQKQLAVTISMGVSACPSHAMTAEDLIAVADQALYRAKSAGRNQICLPTNF